MTLPHDHQERLLRARQSLEGLALGDAFGEQFFALGSGAIADRTLPDGPWQFTDDTVLACAIFRVLAEKGGIAQDSLAIEFAETYAREPWRGYGGMAHKILREIGTGRLWREAATEAFGGEGSMGNGGAMRAAPVGAYFAGDPERIAREAALSAEITHAHPEGQAGAIAVALAAGWSSAHGRSESIEGMFETVLRYTPEGETRRRINQAAGMLAMDIGEVVAAIGNGSGVISQDTVPFVLWNAAKNPKNYAEALWTTVSGGGDIDTTCAMVGGIVSMMAEPRTIPGDWMESRETLERHVPV